MNEPTSNQGVSPAPGDPRRGSPIVWVALLGFFGVVFVVLSLARLFVQSESGTSAPSPPSGSYVQSEASVSLQGSVSFEVKAYNGTTDATAAARSVFQRISWADLSRLKVDLEAGEIVVGVDVKGDSFDTTEAKSGLEEAGFSIGSMGLMAD